MAVMKNRYNKLSGVILTTKTSPNTIASIFHERWVANYDIPSKLHIDSGPQIMSKSFASVQHSCGE